MLAFPADDIHPRNDDKRKTFELNLENEGLELEREQTQRIHFVKIHAPKDVLCRYSEYLKIKMPIKRVNIIFIIFFTNLPCQGESVQRLLLYLEFHSFSFGLIGVQIRVIVSKIYSAPCTVKMLAK